MSQPDELTPRRIALTLLFVLWLSVQPLLVGLSPSWGYFIPHNHLTYGVVTDSDWAEHMQEHLRGATFMATRSGSVATHGKDKAITASLPGAFDAVSVSSWGYANLAKTEIELPAPNTLFVPLTLTCCTSYEMYYPPFDPPPNL